MPSWWVFDLKCQDGCKNSIEKFESFGREKFGDGDFWSFDIVMGKSKSLSNCRSCRRWGSTDHGRVFGGPSKGLDVQVGSKIPVARRAPCGHNEGHPPFLKLVRVEGIVLLIIPSRSHTASAYQQIASCQNG